MPFHNSLNVPPVALVTATVCTSLTPPVPEPCMRAVTVWSIGLVSPAMLKRAPIGITVPDSGC